MVQVIRDSGINRLQITGGGGTPGGSDTQVQYNDGGVFAGSSYLLFDASAAKLSIVSLVDATSGVFIENAGMSLGSSTDKMLVANNGFTFTSLGAYGGGLTFDGWLNFECEDSMLFGVLNDIGFSASSGTISFTAPNITLSSESAFTAPFGSTTTPTASFNALAGQTAPVFQTKDELGAVTSSIDPDGNITAANLGTASALNIHVGTTAPGSPSVGDLWVDTSV